MICKEYNTVITYLIENDIEEEFKNTSGIILNRR